jgi:putative ABC transport system substrate-binding protein
MMLSCRQIVRGRQTSRFADRAPTKFELVINLKITKQIGLTIPANVLPRADKVIK